MPLNYVVVIGGANMDIVAQTGTPLMASDSTPGEIRCAPGGVARNVAENLARLGEQVQLVSVAGDDPFGHILLDATRDAGVDITAFRVLPSRRSSTYLSVHGLDGDMAVAVNDMGILDSITPDYLRSLQAPLQAASCWALDCNLSSDALQWLFGNASQMPVFVDGVSAAKCTKLIPWLPRIHTLKVNGLEAQTLSGLPAQSVHEAQLAARALHQTGVRRVVISLGAKGTCWCDSNGQVGHRAARKVAVVNTSGAGDALLAGLVHSHLGAMPLPESVELAMACAELTLSSTFANNPNLSLATVQHQLAAIASQLFPS